MDDSSYPLAQADHAYAYEGAYRTPDAMSAATRDAYGMRVRSDADVGSGFRVAMRAAAAQVRITAGTRASWSGPNYPIPTPRHANTSTRNYAPQAALERARSVTYAPARIRPRPPRPASFYYLFTSAAGCAVRAIVWRGRVFCGGKRPCPISTP